MLIVWFFVYKKLAQFAARCALPPGRSESPVCATVNKPSCVLRLLGWFIGSRGFSSLERRPEFWVLHSEHKLLSPLQLLSGILLPSGPAGSSVRTTVGVLSSLSLPPNSLGRHFLTLFFLLL